MERRKLLKAMAVSGIGSIGGVAGVGSAQTSENWTRIYIYAHEDSEWASSEIRPINDGAIKSYIRTFWEESLSDEFKIGMWGEGTVSDADLEPYVDSGGNRPLLDGFEEWIEDERSDTSEEGKIFGLVHNDYRSSLPSGSTPGKAFGGRYHSVLPSTFRVIEDRGRNEFWNNKTLARIISHEIGHCCLPPTVKHHYLGDYKADNPGIATIMSQSLEETDCRAGNPVYDWETELGNRFGSETTRVMEYWMEHGDIIYGIDECAKT